MYDFTPPAIRLSNSWARKRAFKLNGYCYLQYIKPSKRREALRSLHYKLNPTAQEVWGLRELFHGYVDHYEITNTAPGLVHLKRHNLPNPGYFQRTFSFSVGKIGATRPDMKIHPYPDQHVVLVDVNQRTPTEHEAVSIASVFLQKQTARQDWAKEHPEDQTLGQYVRDYFRSPNVNEDLKDNEAFRDYLTRTYARSMTSPANKTTFRRTLLLACALEQTCAHQKNLASEKEAALQKRDDAEKERKRIKRESDQNLANALKQTEQIREELESRNKIIDEVRTELHKTNERRKQDQERLSMVDQNLAKAEENLHAIADKWMLQLEMSEFTGWNFNMNLMKRLAKIRSLLTGGIDTLSFNLDQLEADAQEFRESHDDAHSQNMNWALMLERTMNGLKDMPDVETEIRRLQKRANQTPYWDLLNTPPAERRFTATSEELANEIRTRILSDLGSIWAELPRDVIAPPASPLTNIKESISRLKSKINRLSTSFTNNQQNQPPPETMADAATAARTLAQQEIYNTIDERFRRNAAGEEIPFSEENLLTAIREFNARVMCNHVPEMAAAIGNHMRPDHQGQWPLMLTHVHHHCQPRDFDPAPPEGSRAPSPAPSHVSMSDVDHGEHHIPLPGIRAGTWRNFRGDLATFDGDNSKYAEWKNQLRVWVGTNPDAPPQLVVAHILTRLVGAASYWAVRNRGNRFSMLGALEVPPALAVEQLLTEMDKAYTAIGAEVAAQNHIRTIKQGDQESMTEYLVKFQKMLEESGYDETDKFILDRFPNSLRGPVRDQLNLEISRRRLNDDPPFRFNQMTRWAQHWDTLIPRQRRQNNEERPRRDAPAESSYSTSFQLPHECLQHTDRNGCPTFLRGSLGDRESAGGVWKRAAIMEQGRCLTCRGLKQPGEQGYVATPPAPPAEWPADVPQPAPRVTRSGQQAGRGRGYRGRGQ